MKATDNQTRITVWIDKDLLHQFSRLHPMHGSVTTFVRKAMENHLKKVKKEMESLEM